jgi:hypothetical protein
MGSGKQLVWMTIDGWTSGAATALPLLQPGPVGPTGTLALRIGEC